MVQERAVVRLGLGSEEQRRQKHLQLSKIKASRLAREESMFQSGEYTGSSNGGLSPLAPQVRLKLIERIVYGVEMEGGLIARLSDLETGLLGVCGQGALPSRLHALEDLLQLDVSSPAPSGAAVDQWVGGTANSTLDEDGADGEGDFARVVERSASPSLGASSQPQTKKPKPSKRPQPCYLQPKSPKVPVETNVSRDASQQSPLSTGSAQKEKTARHPPVSPAPTGPTGPTGPKTFNKTVCVTVEGAVCSKFQAEVFKSAVSSRVGLPMQSMQTVHTTVAKTSATQASVAITLNLVELTTRTWRALRQLPGAILAGYKAVKVVDVTIEEASEQVSLQSSPGKTKAKTRLKKVAHAVLAVSSRPTVQVGSDELSRITDMATAALSERKVDLLPDESKPGGDDVGNDDDFLMAEELAGASLGNARPRSMSPGCKPKASKWQKVQAMTHVVNQLKQTYTQRGHGSPDQRHEYGTLGTNTSPKRSRLVRIAGKVYLISACCYD